VYKSIGETNRTNHVSPFFLVSPLTLTTILVTVVIDGYLFV